MAPDPPEKTHITRKGLGKGTRWAHPQNKQKNPAACAWSLPSRSSSCPCSVVAGEGAALQGRRHLSLSSRTQPRPRGAPHVGAQRRNSYAMNQAERIQPSSSTGSLVGGSSHGLIRLGKKEEQDCLLQRKYLHRQIINPVGLADQSRGMAW